MIRDISPPVSADTEVFPGDTPFSSRRVLSLEDGGSCNVTTIETTVHVGAHVDGPLHFSGDGADAADVDLGSYLGPCRVIHVPTAGAVSRADLAARDLLGVERLLVRTRSEGGPARFERDTAWLGTDAAGWAGAAGLKLVGIDTFSVDPQDSKDLPSHHALLAAGVRILEGIDLEGVPEGDYELIALPLRLVGVDSSPVRAVLRDLPAAR
jgi:arylformamidase